MRADLAGLRARLERNTVELAAGSRLRAVPVWETDFLGPENLVWRYARRVVFD